MKFIIKNHSCSRLNILAFLSAFAFLMSCDAIKKTQSNPIDLVLGDKYIKEKDSIRQNNFTDFVGISAKYLEKNAAIYDIQKIDNQTFLLQPKKSYSEARNFNAILKVKNDKIAHYYILNDLKVVGYNTFGNDVILLYDNFEVQNRWATKNQVVVERIDADFRSVWKYELPKKQKAILPIRANAFQQKQNEQTATCLIDVIFGCSMCYKTIALQLNSADGKFISATKVYEENSPENMSNETLEAIFKQD